VLAALTSRISGIHNPNMSKAHLTVRLQAAKRATTSREGVVRTGLSTEKSRAQAASRMKVGLGLQSQESQYLFSVEDAANAVIHHKKVSFG
jgi:hypothetical protein